MDRFAIVRDIPLSYQQCITNFHGDPINAEVAKGQHKKYCDALLQLGLKLIKINADDSLPDCCFTEDTAIIFGDIAIITHPGTQSRVAETIEMEKALLPLRKIFNIKEPATIEGGDVLKIGKKIFIGNSSRTNEAGIKQLAAIIEPLGYKVIAVKINDTLHLKSVCTYLGNNVVIFAKGHFDEKIFSEYDSIIVPASETYCANTLAIDGTVIIPTGFPATRSLIREKGFPVIELEMSEIEKADGALTCLSVIL